MTSGEWLAGLPGGPAVVTLGVFDGVHRGHARIIATALAAAEPLGLPLVAVTFDPHPEDVLRPGHHTPRLCSLERRVSLLRSLGVATVSVIPFTPEFARVEAAEFAQAALSERLGARLVVVGENFRFGYRAAGDAR